MTEHLLIQLEDGELDLPLQTLESTTLSMFIDFRKADQKGWDHIRSQEGDYDLLDLDEYRIEAVLMMYPKFTDEQKELFHQIEYQLDDDLDIYKGIFRLSVGEPISIERLYVHYFNMFNTLYFEILETALKSMPLEKLNDRDKGIVESMKSNASTLDERFTRLLQFSELFGTCKLGKEILSFEYKDETFYVQQKDIERLYAKQNYTAGEVIARNEIRKQCQERISRLGDTDGLYEMEMSCKELAILCRKENEKLPYFRIEQKKFINMRADFFAEIPMMQYYPIVFFWILTWRRLDMIPSTEHFLKTSIKGLEGNRKTQR